MSTSSLLQKFSSLPLELRLQAYTDGLNHSGNDIVNYSRFAINLDDDFINLLRGCSAMPRIANVSYFLLIARLIQECS